MLSRIFYYVKGAFILNIEFDKKFLDDETKEILDAATSLEVSVLDKAYKNIQRMAKQFIKEYENMTVLLNKYEQELKNIIKHWSNLKKTLDKKALEASYIAYRANRQKIKQEYFSQEIQNKVLETYNSALKFQMVINAVLNQIVATTYVWSGARGNPETYVIYDMSQFLKLDVDKLGNVVVRYRDNASLLREHAKKIEDSITPTSLFNFKALQDVYKKTEERFNTYKIKKSGSSFILWRNPTANAEKWHGTLVSSFGSVNEAYATILIHQCFSPTKQKEDDMEQFMSYVLQVTNLSGTLQGDTTVGRMELAIKSKSSTTLSIQQLYTISQDIIKKTSFQEIQEYLESVKKKNREAQKRINVDLNNALKNVTETNLQNVIDELKL